MAKSRQGSFPLDSDEEVIAPDLRKSGQQWIESLLQTYYTEVTKDEGVPKSENDSTKDVTQNETEEGESSSALEALTSPKSGVEVTVLSFEVFKSMPSVGSNVSSLSTLLQIRVRFLLQQGEAMTEMGGAFVAKLPPELDLARDMATLANVAKRESHFYTEVVPHINNWTKSKNVKISLPVPKCYFGKWNRALWKRAVKDIEIHFPYAESIILLEDLNENGFWKRNYVEGLTIDETKAAIYALAKVHSITWVMQEAGETGPLFTMAQKPLETAVLYDVLLSEGIQTLKNFLSSQPSMKKMLKNIERMEAKLRGSLVILMEPSPKPAPTTLTHMDFWVDNLVFRTKRFEDTDRDLEPQLEPKPRIKNSRMECRVLDWQMMGRGRPTHDLALLILTSMPTAERRANTDLLLNYYFQVFEETAAIFGFRLPFGMECIRDEFQKSKLLAFFFVIASIDLVLGDETTQKRFLALIQELINENII